MAIYDQSQGCQNYGAELRLTNKYAQKFAMNSPPANYSMRQKLSLLTPTEADVPDGQENQPPPTFQNRGEASTSEKKENDDVLKTEDSAMARAEKVQPKYYSRFM